MRSHKGPLALVSVLFLLCGPNARLHAQTTPVINIRLTSLLTPETKAQRSGRRARMLQRVHHRPLEGRLRSTSRVRFRTGN